MNTAVPPEKSVLIAAFSGRGLSAAARRAEYAPLVADMFADADTLEMSADTRQVDGSLSHGFIAEALIEALAAMAQGRSPAGLVYGAGFEAAPAVLAAIGERWRILGNPPDVIARVKQPEAFASACRKLGVPHPDITRMPPSEPAGWLQKQGGGAGGSHVRAYAGGPVAGEDTYFQRAVSGRSVSALFVSARDGTRIIGFSSQWCAPSPEEPFRFGGAVRPARISSQIETQLTEAVHATAAEFRLTGLNAADFIVDDGGWWLLEVNPRPGATLDIFDSDAAPLFALHMAAVSGAPLPPVPKPDGAAAMQILYVLRAKCAMPNVHYPTWIADRPRAGISLEADAPFCTVLAKAGSACDAETLCAERARQWFAIVDECG